MRIRLLLVPVLAAAGFVVPTQPAAADPLWRGCQSNQNSKWCSTITRNIENNRLIGYRDSISNRTNGPITASCQASQAKTSKFTVGAELSTSIKAGIFGGIDAKVNSSVERSMTTGFVTSATFKVPARTVRYCDRGIVQERVKGRTKIWWFSGGAGQTTKYWTAKAPARARWWIY